MISKFIKYLKFNLATILFFGVFVLLLFIHNLYHGNVDLSKIKNKKKSNLKVDSLKLSSIKEDSSLNNELICSNIKSSFIWSDYDDNQYSISYSVCDSIYNLCKINRSQAKFETDIFNEVNYNGYYSQLVNYDKQYLAKIINLYRNLSDKKGLKNLKVAEFIVSSIQNIKYVLVHNYSCEEYIEHNKNGAMSSYEHGSGRCEPNINIFGVASPIEVLTNQQADCDSRTVFLFTILTTFGFDVVILNSDKEAHSILGISYENITGDYFYDLKTNKPYYVWETTAFASGFWGTYFKPGVYPNSKTFNQDDWQIALRTTDIN